MKEINFEKINEDYEKMNENEKLAVRYGAEGRNLSQVIKNSPEKIESPDKIFDAWDMGVNMRKNGTSKNFLSGIEKEIMDSLSHPNGISDEPLKDIWGNDLAGEYSPAKGETKKEDAGNFKLHLEESEKYLLQPDEKYDKMYMANYSNEVSSDKGRDKKYKFSIKPEDIYKAIGWLCTIGGLFKGGVPSAIDLADQNLLSQQEEAELPEFHYTMGGDDIYRALEDWHHEQMSNK